MDLPRNFIFKIDRNLVFHQFSEVVQHSVSADVRLIPIIALRCNRLQIPTMSLKMCLSIVVVIRDQSLETNDVKHDRRKWCYCDALHDP